MTDSLDADDTSSDLDNDPAAMHGSEPGDPGALGTDGAAPAADGPEGPQGVAEALESVPDDLTCPDCAAEGRHFVATSERGYRSHRTRSHSGPSAPGSGEKPGPTGPDETVPGEPPKERRKTLKEWIAARRAGEAKPTKPKRAWGTKGPREPLDEPIGWVYGRLGHLMVRGGSKYAPVGRVMQMQSPAVGVIGDAALKGSILDKIAQPLVREGKQYKELGETIALPVATAMVIANPDMLGLRVDEQGQIFATGWAWEPYYALWETMAVQMAQGYERVEVKKREIGAELAKIPWLQPIIEQGLDPIVYMIVDVLGVQPTPMGPGSKEPPVDVPGQPTSPSPVP